MSNFLQMLRLKNLFDPNSMGQMDPMQMAQTPQLGPQNMGPLPQPMNQPTPNMPPEYDPVARMREMYTPETSASDRYNGMVDNFPQEVQPSGKRRVGGAILGALTDLGTNLGGNRTGVKGSNVYDETTGKNKYLEAVDKWKEQIGPAGTAAQLEKGNNASERQMASTTINQELAGRRDDARNTKNTADTKIREDRAAVYRYKTEHPGMKFDFSGPTVLIADPLSGKVTSTGISTGSLSDADKLDLGQKNALSRIDRQAGNAIDLEGVRQENRLDLVGARGTETRTTNAAKPPTGSTGRPELPTQTKARQYNAAQQFATKNPDLAKFIKLGKGNEFRVSPPSAGGFFTSAGPTPEQHRQITDAIFSGGITAPTTGIRVIDSNGKTGTYKGTAAEAIKEGFKVVQ